MFTGIPLVIVAVGYFVIFVLTFIYIFVLKGIPLVIEDVGDLVISLVDSYILLVSFAVIDELFLC